MIRESQEGRNAISLGTVETGLVCPQTVAAVANRENPEREGKAKSSRQEGLLGQIAKTLQLLSANPRHPGLQTHEYDSLANPFDSKQMVFGGLRAKPDDRRISIFWCYGSAKGQIVIIAITPHP